MTLRSFITTPQAAHQDLSFPKLMIWDGPLDNPKFIIFATRRTKSEQLPDEDYVKGFVVWSEEQGDHKISKRFLGEEAEWVARHFKDWYGTIAFQQDLCLVALGKN